MRTFVKNNISILSLVFLLLLYSLLMLFNFKDEKRKSFLHENTSSAAPVIDTKIVSQD
ncbi:hypothetical protein IIF7_09648 [Zunongwangia atlantica 22II14-10F7]|uniref:Uncharacterized protein n=1 Tax=Zunongwangia atlantica 22II14-10F7 TaxID=1185767 RepID=A0A1Y1T4G1_9FLAO|nr:hypothetical protein IIF7_09648 [Zunongwangia atlantica 22II14-10F7]